MKKVFLPLLSFVLGFLFNVNAFSQNLDSDYGSGNILSDFPSPIVLSPTTNYYGAFYALNTFPSLPAIACYIESAIIGDTLYAHVPTTIGTASTTFMKYKITSSGSGGGEWLTGTSLPVPLIGGSMTACNGKLYFIGGGSSFSTPGTAVYEYSPATGQWTTKAPLPVAKACHGSVCWGDSVIFVMGGPYTTTPSTNLEVMAYRASTDTWMLLTGSNHLPSGAGRRTFGIGIDMNKIIIAGGYAGAYLKSTYVGTIGADASVISWSVAPDISTTYLGLSRLGGTAANGYFFTVGGERSGVTPNSEDTIHVYSFQSNTWVFNFGVKPIGVSNVFNSVSSKVFSDDTIKVFCVGGYNGTLVSAIANLDVAKFKTTESVGAQYIANDNTFSLYPNPTNSIFGITVNENVTAEIVNISGQLVSKQDLISGTNNIDISAYAKGIYFVTVKGNKISKTQKLIVQ